jgi:hypothetical protein
VGFVGGETGYCSETWVMGGVGGTGEAGVKFVDTIHIKKEVSIEVEDAVYIKEEVSSEVEDAVDIKEEVGIEVEDPLDTKEEVSIKFETVSIKDEVQECLSVPPIKTEQEVRGVGVCKVMAAHGFRPFVWPKNEIVILNLTIACVVLYRVFWLEVYKNTCLRFST